MEDWLLFALASGLLFGLSNVFVKLFAGKAPSALMLALTGIFVALVAGAAYFLFPQQQAGDLAPVAGFVAAFAVLWSAGALFQYKAFENPAAPLSIAGVLITTALSLSTYALGVLVFGDKVSAQKLAGVALAVAGAALLAL
jgi:uncharacterized membrane protein